jgi:hypothetical protein
MRRKGDCRHAGTYLYGPNVPNRLKGPNMALSKTSMAREA